MAYELIYTSAERGLRPGTRGYCTVAYTQGMMPQTVQLMEALSAYKSMYGAQEAAAMTEPVSWSHYKMTLLGHASSVLSRVSPTGVDHTNRSNKLAHHILVQSRERPAGGPLWVSSQEGMFIEQWEGTPRLLTTPKTLPTGDETDFHCNRWAELTGDAGHAGMLASHYHSSPDAPVFLAYEPGMDVFGLLREEMALLPLERHVQHVFHDSSGRRDMRLALLRRGFGGVAGRAAQSEGDRDGFDEAAAGAVGGKRLCPPCPRRRRPCGRRAAAGARQAEIQAVGPA